MCPNFRPITGSYAKLRKLSATAKLVQSHIMPIFFFDVLSESCSIKHSLLINVIKLISPPMSLSGVLLCDHFYVHLLTYYSALVCEPGTANSNASIYMHAHGNVFCTWWTSSLCTQLKTGVYTIHPSVLGWLFKFKWINTFLLKLGIFRV